MSKNVFWMIVIVIAAVVGAMLGPALLDDVPPGLVLILGGLLVIGLIVLVVYSLSGNKGSRRADPGVEADARTLRAAPGKARVYFIRRGFVASLQGMNVSIDGSGSGQIKSGQFLMAELEPGDHRLTARMARGGKSTASSIELSLAPGEAAFLHAIVEMGALAATTKLTRIDEARARDELSSAKMMVWEGAPPR